MTADCLQFVVRFSNFAEGNIGANWHLSQILEAKRTDLFGEAPVDLQVPGCFKELLDLEN